MALNNELIFSFVDEKNKVTTYLYNNVSNSRAMTNIGGSNIQSTKNGVIPKMIVGRKSNYDPNNTSDPYGYNNNYRLKYANYHTLNEQDSKSSVEINCITLEPIYYMGAVTCTSIRSTRYDHKSDDYMQYRTAVTRFIYDNSNNTYSPSIVNDKSFHRIAGSGNLSYTLNLPSDTGKNTSERKFESKIHSNFVPVFGDCTITEDTHNGTLTFNFTSSNISEYIRNQGKLGLGIMVDNPINPFNNIISSANVGMSTTLKTNTVSAYSFTTKWDNAAYKYVTGTTLQQDNFTISGNFYMQLYGGGMLVDQYTSGFVHTFNYPTVNPHFYRTSSVSPVSGYVSYSWVRAYYEPDDTFKRAEIIYQDASNNWKHFDIPQGGRLNFWKHHRHLNGKPVQIKAYYKTIANEMKLYSDVLCSAYHNYFDIDDVTLTLSGVRYDTTTSGNVLLTSNYIEEDSGTILNNKVGQKFQSIDVAKAYVDFTLNVNETDIYDNTRTKSPGPQTIYLIAVPLTAKNDSDVQRLCLQIPSDRILTDRDTTSKLSLFPSINTEGANAITTLCTGSPNTATAKGLMWNSIALPVYESPSAGEFLTSTYSISVDLYQNSWIFYLVIKDSENTCSAYCISNTPYFDMPTADKFQT